MDSVQLAVSGHVEVLPEGARSAGHENPSATHSILGS